MLGRTVMSEEIGENLEYIMGSSPSSDLDRQTPSRVLVEHGQKLQRTAVVGSRDVRAPSYPVKYVIARDGRFVEVGASLADRDLEGAEVVDLDDDDTVLPGFFDLHAHYGMTLVRQGRVDECVYNPLIYLATG